MINHRNYLKNLFKRYKIYPSKRLGQNFLIDKGIIKKIIEAADLKPDDKVLEIGPGIGNLTIELAKKVKEVIAVEKDQKMCQILKEILEGWNVKNIKIIQGDILKIKNLKLKIKNFKVVANLPFYLTAPTIRKFLESENPPKEMILVVQKEVAQRICAKPPDMNLLAVSVQFYAKPEIIDYVSRNNFWPRPKVDSAIIKITPSFNEFAWVHSHFANRRRASAFRMLFFKVVRAGFSQPRKQILNNLATGLKINPVGKSGELFTQALFRDKVSNRGLSNGVNKEKVKNWLLKNKIQPSQRAETLTIKDWGFLTKSFRNFFIFIFFLVFLL